MLQLRLNNRQPIIRHPLDQSHQQKWWFNEYILDFFPSWHQNLTWILQTTIQNAKIYNCTYPTENAMSNPTQKTQIKVTKEQSISMWYKIGFSKLYASYLRKFTDKYRQTKKYRVWQRHYCRLAASIIHVMIACNTSVCIFDWVHRRRNL